MSRRIICRGTRQPIEKCDGLRCILLRPSQGGTDQGEARERMTNNELNQILEGAEA